VNSPGRDGKRDRSVSNVRNGAVTFAIAALILLRPVIAFLIVITADADRRCYRGEGDRNLRRLRWRHRMDLVRQEPAAFEGSTSIEAGAGLRRSGHSSFANVTACRPPSAAFTANIFNHTNRKRSSESHDAI
jgi:hypothetical protein